VGGRELPVAAWGPCTVPPLVGVGDLEHPDLHSSYPDGDVVHSRAVEGPVWVHQPCPPIVGVHLGMPAQNLLVNRLRWRWRNHRRSRCGRSRR